MGQNFVRKLEAWLQNLFFIIFQHSFTVNCSQQWGLDWLHDWDEPFGYFSDCDSTWLLQLWLLQLLRLICPVPLSQVAVWRLLWWRWGCSFPVLTMSNFCVLATSVDRISDLPFKIRLRSCSEKNKAARRFVELNFSEPAQKLGLLPSNEMSFITENESDVFSN